MSEKKVAVVAVGGNSLIKDKQHQSVEDQYQAILETSRHITDMIEADYNVVVTHGNGPQVGFILMRSEEARKSLGLHAVPLDSCGADTQGAIGYQFQKALKNEFKTRNKNAKVATIVTQVVVDKKDEAFLKPTKPIGPFYTEEEANKLKETDGWDMVEDSGRGYRRVVASPMPQEILEEDSIKTLIANDTLVIAVGGGGIPVCYNDEGMLEGVAAVIDKDFASSLLASNIKADLFVISTAVEQVCLNFGTPEEKSLDNITIDEAKKYMDEGHFKPGSMLPKIKAAIMFLENGGKEVLITNPESIKLALEGKTGTRIR